MNMTAPKGIDVIAIVGAGSGIGRALAQHLARENVTVIAMGRTQATLDETCMGLENTITFTLDMKDAVACEQAFDDIEAQLKQPVDAVVICSAIYHKEYFLDQSPEAFEDTIVTNVVGVANVVRAVLPQMLERNVGRIVALGSLADQNPIPSASSYSVSKGALHALVKGIASEIDRTRYPNVLVNEFLPPATKTAMSGFGAKPSDLAPMIQRLIDFPSGGPTGSSWAGTKQIFFGEGLKASLLRALKLKR